MKKWIALALMLVITLSAKAEHSAFDDAFDRAMSSCNNGVESKCWRPLADALSKAPPGDENYERVFQYWMLAKLAYYSGDFADSRKFFDKTLDFAKDIQFPDDHGYPTHQDTARLMVGLDIAALDLSEHDYSSALHHIEAYVAFEKDVRKNRDESSSAVLLQSAALVGLKRTAEADVLLQDLVRKLDFDARGPVDGWLLGPEPMNPYSAAQRIAAYDMRAGRYEQALNLLDDIEQKRKLKLSTTSGDMRPGIPWAALVDPADILFAKAVVYLAQSKDDKAEPLLHEALAMPDKSEGRSTKRALIHLAELDKRSGKNKEAEELATRAAAIHPLRTWEDVDPLADTLGFAQ